MRFRESRLGDSTQSLVQINLYQSQIHPDTAMVAGTWLVLEDLSSVQFELYRGGLTPQGPFQGVCITKREKAESEAQIQSVRGKKLEGELHRILSAPAILAGGLDF